MSNDLSKPTIDPQGTVVTIPSPRRFIKPAIIVALVIGAGWIASRYYSIEPKQPPLEARSVRVGLLAGWEKAINAVNLRTPAGGPDTAAQNAAVKSFFKLADSLLEASGEKAQGK